MRQHESSECWSRPELSHGGDTSGPDDTSPTGYQRGSASSSGHFPTADSNVNGTLCSWRPYSCTLCTPIYTLFYLVEMVVAVSRQRLELLPHKPEGPASIPGRVLSGCVFLCHRVVVCLPRYEVVENGWTEVVLFGNQHTPETGRK